MVSPHKAVASGLMRVPHRRKCALCTFKDLSLQSNLLFCSALTIVAVKPFNPFVCKQVQSFTRFFTAAVVVYKVVVYKGQPAQERRFLGQSKKRGAGDSTPPPYALQAAAF